jgi:hypothetical protein
MANETPYAARHVCETHDTWDHKPQIKSSPLVDEYLSLQKAGVQPTDVKRQLGFLGTTAETLKEPDGSSLRIHFASAGSDDIKDIEKFGPKRNLLEFDNLENKADLGLTSIWRFGDGTNGSFGHATTIIDDNLAQTQTTVHSQQNGHEIVSTDTERLFWPTTHTVSGVDRCKPGDKQIQ